MYISSLSFHNGFDILTVLIVASFLYFIVFGILYKPLIIKIASVLLLTVFLFLVFPIMFELNMKIMNYSDFFFAKGNAFLGIFLATSLHIIKRYSWIYKIKVFFRDNKTEREYIKAQKKTESRMKLELEIQQEKTNQDKISAERQTEKFQHERPQKSKALDEIINKIDDL